MATSQVRQNFHNDSETAINKQINLELHASYVYLVMSHHFERDDVALGNVAKFFAKSSDEEREHAQLLMRYQNERGGRILLSDVTKPAKTEWMNSLDAFESALALEKRVNQSLLELHKTADAVNDAHLSDFIEEHFLDEQVKSIKELAELITNLKRVGTGLGEFMFDKEAFE